MSHNDTRRGSYERAWIETTQMPDDPQGPHSRGSYEPRGFETPPADAEEQLEEGRGSYEPRGLKKRGLA